MENQHRQITGYRDLSRAEIDAMNRCKAQGEECRRLLDDVAAASAKSGGYDPDPRALAIARTKIQEGFMWLNRSIAKPTTFAGILLLLLPLLAFVTLAQGAFAIVVPTGLPGSAVGSHGDPVITNEGTDSCGDRIAGPGGSYINGPAQAVGTFDGIFVPPGSSYVLMHGCGSSIFEYLVENLSPRGWGELRAGNLKIHLRVDVNGQTVEFDWFPNEDILVEDLAPYDGFTDWTGTSGRFGLTQIQATGFSIPIPVPPGDQGRWATTFPAMFTVSMQGANVRTTGAVVGSIDGFWRLGVSFTAPAG